MGLMLGVLFFLSSCVSYPAEKMTVNQIRKKYPDISSRKAYAIKFGQVSLDMTKQMVLDAWGMPKDKISTPGDNTKVKWIYGGSHGAQVKVEGLVIKGKPEAIHVYFNKEGRVVKVEDQ